LGTEIIVKKRLPGLSAGPLARFVARVRRALGLKGKVSILLTSNRELQNMNRRFLGKDRPTDVLSFPAAEGAVGVAGDLAISVEIAASNAKRMGHSVTEEVRILVVHGMLHLAGYDHERDDGQMARKERQLRRSLRLPEGLTERAARGASVPGQARKRRRPPRGARASR